MTSILVTSQELVPIAPEFAGQAIVPDQVAVVEIYSDVTQATFAAPPTLDGGPAVWVKDLDPGTYKVLCKMDPQPDQQEPIWELDGTIVVIGRA